MTQSWHNAITSGNAAATADLIRAGADVNARDKYGQTGLMLASHRGHRDVIAALIRSGADLDVTAKFGLSALMLAIVAGHTDIARMLAEAGADLSVRGSGAPGFTGKAARDLAMERGLLDLANELDQSNANPDVLASRAYQARRTGRLADARQLYADAADGHRASGNLLSHAHAIRHVGDIHRDEGQPELAEPCYREALDLYRRHGDPPLLDLANALRSMAMLKDEAGANEEAGLLWQEAQDLYGAANVAEGAAECAARLARLSRLRNPAG